MNARSARIVVIPDAGTTRKTDEGLPHLITPTAKRTRIAQERLFGSG
jgi:hypothetical protein